MHVYLTTFLIASQIFDLLFSLMCRWEVHVRFVLEIEPNRKYRNNQNCFLTLNTVSAYYNKCKEAIKKTDCAKKAA